MGVWSRVRRAFRSESHLTAQAEERAFRYEQMRLKDAGNDDTDPLGFTSDLVTGQYTDKTVWENLLKVAWEDPIIHRICVQLAENVFDDWFVIVNNDEEREEHKDNKRIQEQFTRMDSKQHFTQALIGERIFGSCAMVFNYNKHRTDTLGNGDQIAELDIFTKENIVIPTEAYNDLGIPDYIHVYPSGLNVGDPDVVPWEDLLWFCTRPIGRTIEGYPASFPIWDNATYLRESVDAMAWTHKKFGVGLFMWYLKVGLDDAMHADFEDSLQDSGSRRAIVVENDDVDRVEWIGPPASGTTAIVEGSDFMLGLISSGSGIPKDIFTGLSAGAITGSEINNKALYATISRIQATMVPYILAVIEKMGFKIEGMDIEFNTRYATDEMEQAQVRLYHAQAEQLEMLSAQGAGPNDIRVGVKEGSDPEKENNTGGLR